MEKSIFLHPLNVLEVSELISYIIPLKGLKPGIHNYNFHVTDKFFEAMQAEEVFPTNVQVNLDMDYREGLITLSFSGQGHMTFPCDVCLEPFNQELSFKRQVIIKTGEGEPEDDEVFYIAPTENQLDISQYIYEEILLSLPMKKAHPDNPDGTSGCDPEQLKFLESQEGEKPMDPRWEALKKLKFDD
jgi:uncharacterized protein